MKRFGIATLAMAALLAVGGQSDDKPASVKVDVGPGVYELPTTWVKQRPVAAGNLGPVVQYGIPLAKEDAEANFKVQLKVYYFSGGGGGVQQNVDRWVGMFEESGREKKSEEFSNDGFKVTYVDIAGTYKDKPFPMAEEFTLKKDFRMLAAVVETPGDGPYFFRAVGPAKTMAANVDAFKAMVKNVKKAVTK